MRARDNPFAVHRVLRVRYRFDDGDLTGLVARLESSGNRGAIVGEEGSGKTTLLEDLGSELVRRGLEVRSITLGARQRRLTPEQRRSLFGNVGARSVLLLDGADALGRLAWFGVLRRSRRAGGLVITSHREGLLPTLHRTRTSPGLLAAIAGDLTDSAAGRWGAPASGLFERHRGNLRTALRELYDVCASCPDGVLTASVGKKDGSRYRSPVGRRAGSPEGL